MTGRKKDLHRALRRLSAAGCIVLMGSHVRVLGPNGKAITTSSSPSDPHAYKNVLRDAKRHLGVSV